MSEEPFTKIPEWAEDEMRRWVRSKNAIKKTWFRHGPKTWLYMKIAARSRTSVRINIVFDFADFGMNNFIDRTFWVEGIPGEVHKCVVRSLTPTTHVVQNKEELRSIVLGVYKRYMREEYPL